MPEGTEGKVSGEGVENKAEVLIIDEYNKYGLGSYAFLQTDTERTSSRRSTWLSKMR